MNAASERACAYRDALADGLSATAVWRRQKAEEFPEDERNLASAAALTLAAEQIRSVRLDHAVIGALVELDEEFETWGRLEFAPWQFQTLGRAASRFGFDRQPGGIDMPVDLDRLLDDILRETLEGWSETIHDGLDQPPASLVQLFNEWGVPLWEDEEEEDDA